MKDHIHLSAPVKSALSQGQAVVALESTIITHGMPWPQNVETARRVEDIVRSQGAVPATIAVFDGLIHVGLDDRQLSKLAKATGVMKLSRADLAFAVSEKCTGSTTVAATMMAAQMAGIDVFATGGIGGVHSGAETSFDVSADLRELGQTDVVVVCAGAKAILDLPKTLEVLETNGVPVIGYGVDELPAFWSRQSGLAAPLRLDSPAAIASHTRNRRALGIEGGTLIANPVPAEAEIPAVEMADLIGEALACARREGISGKATTPYLLGRIYELSNGRSLTTNIALVENNAKLAARIAVALKQAAR